MPEAASDSSFVVGVISDTHGLLRPEALAALVPAQHILHAGDVGNLEILDALRQIAPVTAIRGNIDTTGPCAEFAATEMIELAGRYIYMVHAIADLDIKPAAAGVSAIIYGHSHKPSSEVRDGVLYLNPGSAGPRRFHLPSRSRYSPSPRRRSSRASSQSFYPPTTPRHPERSAESKDPEAAQIASTARTFRLDEAVCRLITAYGNPPNESVPWGDRAINGPANPACADSPLCTLHP